MELEGSLPCSQEPPTDPYSEQDYSNLYFQYDAHANFQATVG
jgi:hypothetical protein